MTKDEAKEKAADLWDNNRASGYIFYGRKKRQYWFDVSLHRCVIGFRDGLILCPMASGKTFEEAFNNCLMN